jgi:elongation factor P--beta-lysine ligase
VLFRSPEDLHRLPDDVAALSNFKIRDVNVAEQFELWNKAWMLGALIAFLALEWILRKRLGLL